MNYLWAHGFFSKRQSRKISSGNRKARKILSAKRKSRRQLAMEIVKIFSAKRKSRIISSAKAKMAIGLGNSNLVHVMCLFPMFASNYWKIDVSRFEFTLKVVHNAVSPWHFGQKDWYFGRFQTNISDKIFVRFTLFFPLTLAFLSRFDSRCWEKWSISVSLFKKFPSKSPFGLLAKSLLAN